MATAATIAVNIAAIETFLASGQGVASVTIDGMTTKFDRTQAIRELDFWRRELSKASAHKPVLGRIRLSGF
ncbi:MAG TPA: hypothetical protein VMY35_04525 [Phycisphaerae bacterium]|nr:hypothetical protein [Phycisphaerae bacterium]